MKQPAASYIFFTIVFTVFFVVSLYIERRLIARLDMSPRAKRLMRLCYFVLVLVTLFGLFSWRLTRVFDSGAFLTAFQWGTLTALGFLGFVFVLTVAFDLFALAKKLFAKNPMHNSDRREFLKLSSFYSLVGTAGVLSGVSMAEAHSKPEIVTVDIPIPDLPADLEGFRIAQISDLHVGPTIRREFIEDIVEALRQADADVICLTGDAVDGFVEELAPHFEPFAGLSARHGLYYITGNHEYYWDAPGWVAFFRDLGFTPLLNEHRLIEKGNGKLLLAGVTDLMAGRFSAEHESSPKSALNNAPSSHARVLLAHQPRSAFSAGGLGFHLQLSGHTHGGQLFPWNLIVYLVQPFVRGLYRHQDMWVYVNRGTGYWGPPMRLGVRPELTVAVLRRAS